MNEVAKFYDTYTYPHTGHYLYDLNNIFHQTLVGQDNTGRILVIGCGAAEATLCANTNPRAEVIGIDVAPSQIAISKSIKRKKKLHNLTHFVADITKDVVNGDFNHVLACGVLHHIEDVDAALKNIHQSMIPGAKLYGMVYSKHRPPIIRDRVEFFRKAKFTPNEIRTWFKDCEDHLDALAWYGHYQHTDQEIADTWLNPYFKEYDSDELREFLYDHGFKEIKIDLNQSGTNYHFEAIKR